MAAHEAGRVHRQLGYAAASPQRAERWQFGPGKRPPRSAWFANRYPPERATPYAPILDGASPHSHALARPQGKVPMPRKAPTDARGQHDSTPERCPPAHPLRSDTPEPVLEKMFPGASNQISLSMQGQCARLAGVTRDWRRLCAHGRRARAEKPAGAKSQANGSIRNCRAPGECAWRCPIVFSPRPRNLRTPSRRFPCRSLDTTPREKVRTSGRRSAQRKRPFRQSLPRVHLAGEFFLCPGCPEYASPAAHPLRQRLPGARARRGGRPGFELHDVPICLPGASPQFTLSVLGNQTLFRMVERGYHPEVAISLTIRKFTCHVILGVYASIYIWQRDGRSPRNSRSTAP